MTTILLRLVVERRHDGVDETLLADFRVALLEVRDEGVLREQLHLAAAVRKLLGEAGRVLRSLQAQGGEVLEFLPSQLVGAVLDDLAGQTRFSADGVTDITNVLADIGSLDGDFAADGTLALAEPAPLRLDALACRGSLLTGGVAGVAHGLVDHVGRVTDVTADAGDALANEAEAREDGIQDMSGLVTHVDGISGLAEGGFGAPRRAVATAGVSVVKDDGLTWVCNSNICHGFTLGVMPMMDEEPSEVYSFSGSHHDFLEESPEKRYRTHPHSRAHGDEEQTLYSTLLTRRVHRKNGRFEVEKTPEQVPDGQSGIPRVLRTPQPLKVLA